MGDGSDEYGDQYDLETFVRRLMSVQDAPLRRRQVERHFTTVDPETVATHLQAVIEACVVGDAASHEMLFSVGEFVNSATTPEAHALDAVDLAARRQDQNAVAWFLLSPAPAREIDARALANMSVQSRPLGYRKSEAARSDPRVLERLLLDDHPMVIARLCQNPRVSQPQMMTVVTRRPTLPNLLETVASFPRWYRQQPIREALVNNPYGPTGLAIRALPTLPYAAWKSIQHAPQVHEAVRGFAAYLCAVREGTPRPSPAILSETVH